MEPVNETFDPSDPDHVNHLLERTYRLHPWRVYPERSYSGVSEALQRLCPVGGAVTPDAIPHFRQHAREVLAEFGLPVGFDTDRVAGVLRVAVGGLRAKLDILA